MAIDNTPRPRIPDEQPTEEIQESEVKILREDGESSRVLAAVDSSNREVDTAKSMTAKSSSGLSEAILTTSFDWAAIEQDREKLNKSRDALERQCLELDGKIRDFESRSADLLDWSARQRKSFLWKILSKMEDQLATVKATLNRYAIFVKTLSVPELDLLTKARRSFHRTLLLGNVFAALVALLLLNGPRVVSNLSGVPLLGGLANWTNFPSALTIYVYLFTVVFTLLLVELIRYYNTWSSFSRRINLILWELDLVTRNTDHCRSEMARLEGLYPQVKDWLEILGNSLNRPWHIKEEWLRDGSVELSMNRAPFSLRFAQAQEDDPTASRALKRDAIENHLRRGWREEVFVQLIDSVRLSLGLTSDRLNVDVLDRDITFSPGGPRALVKRYISEQEQLERVARTQLLPLMQKVQTESITKARPPVSEARANPLESILENDFGLEEEAKMPWDAFLSLLIGDENRINTPMSILTFSSYGRQAGHVDRAKTIFQGPERLQVKVPSGEAVFTSYPAQSRLPLDILVRLDVTGPIPKEHLLIAQQSQREMEAAVSQFEEDVKARQKTWRTSDL